MPLTNDEWVAVWDIRDWRKRFSVTEREARAVLATFEDVMSTTDLTEAMFPRTTPRGDGVKVRQDMIRTLMKLARTSLKDCAHKNMSVPARKYMGSESRPWLWKRGTVIHRDPCSHCGGSGIEPAAEEPPMRVNITTPLLTR